MGSLGACRLLGGILRRQRNQKSLKAQVQFAAIRGFSRLLSGGFEPPLIFV